MSNDKELLAKIALLEKQLADKGQSNLSFSNKNGFVNIRGFGKGIGFRATNAKALGEFITTMVVPFVDSNRTALENSFKVWSDGKDAEKGASSQAVG